MEAPPYRWIVSDSIPEKVRVCWQAKQDSLLSPQPTTTDVRPRQPNEKEPTPPIPANLQGLVCLYGFAISEERMSAYHAKHSPNEAPPTNFLLHLARNDNAIYSLARRLNLTVYIEHIEGHDNILFFASTDLAGAGAERTVPSASRLKAFALELGVTEKVQWLDAIMDAFHC